MKQCRRLLSLVICVVMVLSILPAAAAAGTEETVTYGTSIGMGVSAVQDGQTIVYGNDAAQWLVLNNSFTTTDEAGIALLAKNIIDANIAFNKGGLDNAWENSDAKVWNAEYAASAFSAGELAGIMDTTKAEQAGAYFGANWSKDALAAEKLFFLSAAEIEAYFGNSIDGLIAEVDGVNDGWWLRSAYTDRDIYGGIVSDSGFVGYPHIAATWGARPAFNISADKVVMTSAAVGGKVSGTVGADALSVVGETSANTWKLTVADEAHSAFTATIGDGSAIKQSIGYASWVLPVSYSGAVAGTNEYVSVVICNQNNTPVYYGHIAENSASGTVNVNMPEGLSGKYTIHVFAEQCNGDNVTDFGSAMISAEIEIDDGMSSVNSWGLVLQGDIRADFMMALSESVISDADAYIQVEVDGVATKTMVSSLTADEKGLYKISANVAAAQMTEDIMIQVVTSDAVGSQFLYSVRKYGDYILANNTDEKTCNLVKAMLNYGGKAQEYFSYNLGALADSGISIVEQEVPHEENVVAKKEGSSDKVKYYGASLIHEHQTSLRFYFTSTDDAIADVTFAASSNGEVIDSDMNVTKVGDKYFVEIVDIAPNKLCDEITISADGFSVTYSPFYYIHRMYYRETSSDTLRDMMKAMYNYYYYAVAYLGE